MADLSKWCVVLATNCIFMLKTNLEKYLFYGPKQSKFINMRYMEDRINFQSEVMLLWSVLKNNLKINSISNSPLKLNPNRMPQKKVTSFY